MINEMDRYAGGEPDYMDRMCVLAERLRHVKRPTYNQVADTIREFEGIINGSWDYHVQPCWAVDTDLESMTVEDLWSEFVGDLAWYSDRLDNTHLMRLTNELDILRRKLRKEEGHGSHIGRMDA